MTRGLAASQGPGDILTLTPRLKATRNALLDGLSRKQVADRLGISIHTVSGYVKKVYETYEVQAQVELIRLFQDIHPCCCSRALGASTNHHDLVTRCIAHYGNPSCHAPPRSNSASRGGTMTSPRLQATLKALLEGQSRKQITATFGISKNTVSGYVKQVYRIHGVNSHAGLMKLFQDDSPDPNLVPNTLRHDKDGFSGNEISYLNGRQTLANPNRSEAYGADIAISEST